MMSDGNKQLCPGVTPAQQQALEALGKGCEVKDLCNASMGELILCWRKEKVAIDDAKSSLERMGNAQTGRFLESYKEGDEVWRYSSPEETWKLNVGSEGYAILRDGKLVGAVQTRIK